jgi:hypothetical protein
MCGLWCALAKGAAFAQKRMPKFGDSGNFSFLLRHHNAML